MPFDPEPATERTHLLNAPAEEGSQSLGTLDQRFDGIRQGNTAPSIISSHLSGKERALAGTAVGERLPYNDYTTIDWLHALVSVS